MIILTDKVDITIFILIAYTPTFIKIMINPYRREGFKDYVNRYLRDLIKTYFTH